MAQQTLQFNQAQLQLLDMMSFVKTPEALSNLNKAISYYFVKKADEEIASKSWVDECAGKWQDQRTTAQIVEDIHKARTNNSEIIL